MDISISKNTLEDESYDKHKKNIISDGEINMKIHKTIQKVTKDIFQRNSFNTAIASIMELLNNLTKYFQQDPRHLLSMRYDDILIDSRKSPYTVLDDVNSNAFAVAHIVNHPSELDEPNCSTLAIDFIDDMKLDELDLLQFVPNQYKKKPMMFGPQAVDTDSIRVHSMGLVALHDIKNQELFYDYRLSPGTHKALPEWYHVFDEEAVRNRWHNDSSD